MTDILNIHFIGTGAAVPSGRRGLPSLAISHDGGVILCDMGEGTQMALRNAELSPSKIHTIMISHLHGDHIFGLPGFITSQQMMDRANPLTLIGPPGLQAFFSALQQTANFEITFPFQIIELAEESTAPFTVGPFTVTAMPLEHRILCLGYRFQEAPKPGKFNVAKAKELGIPTGPERNELKNGNPVTIGDITISPEGLIGPEQPGRCIAYCTDTRPCENTVKLAKDADVLIHDSTFAHEMQERAHKTFHSTSQQAAQTAIEAQCKALFLWHLSIRNDENTEQDMLAKARTIFPATFLSQDFLQYSIPRQGPIA